MSFNENEEQANFQYLNNTDEDDRLKLNLFSHDNWESYNGVMLQKVGEKAKQDLKERGKTPYIFRDKLRN